MKTNKEGIKILHESEKCVLTAYLCPKALENKTKGLPVFFTIGFGNTFYEDGSPVKQGDKITRERADKLFDFILDKFEKEVMSLIKSKVNENQFSALVSFAYNVGTDIDADSIPEGLGDSTLLKKVNTNPNDPSIRDQFMLWINKGSKFENGLKIRRAKEAGLYFKK